MHVKYVILSLMVQKLGQRLKFWTCRSKVAVGSLGQTYLYDYKGNAQVKYAILLMVKKLWQRLRFYTCRSKVIIKVTRSKTLVLSKSLHYKEC